MKKKYLSQLKQHVLRNYPKWKKILVSKNLLFQQKMTRRLNFSILEKKNMWNKFVDKKIIEQIELRFKNEMKELGYL